ncbi:hypothetical protein G6011_11072 [Alternaria panax]|uniref:Uncharacterized protein n=1 Tax=Alternaria panax TaxID=48097 RepID=A0AAD4NQZ8_9PLEO|nr:hypothetical protein G6011_11072 [Alternaria panax]
MGGNKKKNNKNNANANPDEIIKSSSKKKKKKPQNNMFENNGKKEENNDRTLDELNSSPAWSLEESENKAMREADNFFGTSKEPADSSRTTEQIHDVVASERVKDEFLPDELSQPEYLVNEPELFSTTAVDEMSQPELLPTTTQHEIGSSNASHDEHAEKQVSINSWSFDEQEVQDAAESRDDLGDGVQRTPFETQVFEQDVEVTELDDDKKDVVVSNVENIVRHSKLEDEAASREHFGSVLPFQSEPPQQPLQLPSKQPSPVPSKQLLNGRANSTPEQSRESLASTKLPAQEPKFYDRSAPSLQGFTKQSTRKTVPTESQLPSKPKITTQDKEIQTHKSTQTSKPTTKNQGIQISKPGTKNQGTQTTRPTTQDRCIQTPSTWTTSQDQGTQKPKLRDEQSSPLRGILKKTGNTPPSLAEPRLQEKKSSDARRELQLQGILKLQNKNGNKFNQVQSLLPHYSLKHCRRKLLLIVIRSYSLTISRTTGRILKLIVNNNASTFVANREHILATNTTYFTANARESTSTSRGRDFGRYVNFSDAKFSLQVIKKYPQWLYDGVIRTMISPIRVTPAKAVFAFQFLAGAYIFGEHIDDKCWMNDIMDAFISVHIQDWRLEMDLTHRLDYPVYVQLYQADIAYA